MLSRWFCFLHYINLPHFPFTTGIRWWSVIWKRFRVNRRDFLLLSNNWSLWSHSSVYAGKHSSKVTSCTSNIFDHSLSQISFLLWDEALKSSKPHSRSCIFAAVYGHKVCNMRPFSISGNIWTTLHLAFY